jgi:hypothetical protein
VTHVGAYSTKLDFNHRHVPTRRKISNPRARRHKSPRMTVTRWSSQQHGKNTEPRAVECANRSMVTLLRISSRDQLLLSQRCDRNQRFPKRLLFASLRNSIDTHSLDCDVYQNRSLLPRDGGSDPRSFSKNSMGKGKHRCFSPDSCKCLCVSLYPYHV